MSDLLVSIIVPSYNQGAYIRDAIESCLSQDYRPLEIIVIDGASTDQTLDVLKDFDECPEVKWVSEPDSGPVEAVNKGLVMASGEVGAIQSSDDAFAAGAIRKAKEQFERDPELGLLFGNVDRLDAEGNTIARDRIGKFSLARFLARAVHVPQPAAFFRLELAREFGGWDARIPYVPDTDLWLRFAFRSKVRKIDDVLGLLRSHPAQRDTNADRICRDYDLMLEQSPDLAAAPLRYRAAAAAGRRLLRLRYGSPHDVAQLTRLVWGAVLCYPPCLFHGTIPLHRLVPGYFVLAGFVGRLRRRGRRQGRADVTRAGNAVPPGPPLRHACGCWLHERWRTECALNPWLSRLTGISWRDLCNRGEKLEVGSEKTSRVCRWRDSSYLTVSRVFPRVGARILRHCLDHHEVVLRNTPQPPGDSRPLLSVILPVGGSDRVQPFRLALQSLFGQTETRLEVIVIEQGATPMYRDYCPPEVTYMHTEIPRGAAFNKSRAINAGVRLARAEKVLVHDADILVPSDYVADTLSTLDAGYDAVRPLRFLFCLDKPTTEQVMQSESVRGVQRVHKIMQNFPGGSVAIDRNAYWSVGGHDEWFEGWGGEDTEFIGRLSTLRVYRGGYTTGVHLCHPEAVRKLRRERNAVRVHARIAAPPQVRIERLLREQKGRLP
jgi:glycosyltransferase involved in cell wall biosynthesis